MASTLLTLLTEFTYNKNGLLRISYYNDWQGAEESHNFRLRSNLDSDFTACLFKPIYYGETEALAPHSPEESTSLITKNGHRREIFHTLWIKDPSNNHEVYAYDIADNHDLRHFLTITGKPSERAVFLTRMPNLLPG